MTEINVMTKEDAKKVIQIDDLKKDIDSSVTKESLKKALITIHSDKCFVCTDSFGETVAYYFNHVKWSLTCLN